MSLYHIPVLLEESLSNLAIVPDGTYLDLTFGGGGHSLAILKQLSSKGRLISFDQDDEVEQNLKPFENHKNFLFIKANFKYLKYYLDYYQIKYVDGILADLGVSFHQINQAERGFSIKYEAPLDMRMSQKQKLTAYEVINTYSEDKLFYILKQYGEIRQANQLVKHILQNRLTKPIRTTQNLVEIVQSCYSKNVSFRFLAQVFQAFRIEVNQELEALKSLLEQTVEILKPGARIAIISYHSLEDRLVKFFFKTGNFEGKPKKDIYGNLIRPFTPITSKPIMPTLTEIEQNKQARSARLRISYKPCSKAILKKEK